MSNLSQKIWSFATEFFYPSCCILCEGVGCHPICQSCLDELGEPEPRREEEIVELNEMIHAYPYQGRAAQAIQRLKFDRQTGLWEPMSATVLQTFRHYDLESKYDAVVPVPLAPLRKSERGFNQSELIAQKLPHLKPEILSRIRETRPQVESTRAQRWKNLLGAFRASDCTGLRVLLIDDVVTTGATVQECAKTLRKSGAIQVGALSFCGERTIDPDGTSQ